MRLAITRDQNQLSELYAQARAHKVELIPLPLTMIEPMAFVWPLEGNPRVDWLVFTSAHGAESFFNQLHEHEQRLGENTKIAVVGGKTAGAVIRYGHSVEFVPSDSYGETLFRELIDRHVRSRDTLVYARADEVVSDPSEAMKAHGVRYYELICYRSIPVKADRNSVEILDGHDRILFTAPSKVSIYHLQFGKPRARVIAIGNTTAREMERLGWNNIDVLATADIASVWEQL